MSRHLNIARVVIDSPLPHLDRLFDYEIPEELSETCQPGTKVKVKFSNRNMEAWVVDRTQLTSHHKKLAPISKVISNYPVLTPDVLALCQVVADHFLGNLCDVLRFAIPPRQAKIEKNLTEISKITKNEQNDNFSFSSITFPPRLSFEQEIMKKIENQIKANKQSLVMFPNITLVEDFVQKIKNSNSDINVRILSAE